MNPGTKGGVKAVVRTVLGERGALDALGGEGIGEGVDRDEDLGDVLLVEEVRGLESVRDGDAELRRRALASEDQQII